MSKRIKLRSAPITLKDANAYVSAIHRHNGPLPSAKFAVAAINADTGEVHGVAIAGLPKARMLMTTGTLEVNRVCTDGTRDCCSFLYGCCKRAAAALGYSRLITYTTLDEPGTSLKASGWSLDGEAGGGSWVERRGTGTLHENAKKHRWSIIICEDVPPLVFTDTFELQNNQTSLWSAAEEIK